jgi:DNA-binding beta-propeller fold protein YncE
MLAPDTGNGRVHRFDRPNPLANWRFDRTVDVPLTSPVGLGTAGGQAHFATGNGIYTIDFDRPEAPPSPVGDEGEFACEIFGDVPPAMATGAGRVLLTEPGRHRVRLLVEGQPPAWLGGGQDGFQTNEECCAAGSRASQFDGPSGIAIDLAGQIIVADAGEGGRLQKFTPDGRLVVRTLLGFRPGGIALDRTGLLWVTDPEGHRVVRFVP